MVLVLKLTIPVCQFSNRAGMKHELWYIAPSKYHHAVFSNYTLFTLSRNIDLDGDKENVTKLVESSNSVLCFGIGTC